MNAAPPPPPGFEPVPDKPAKVTGMDVLRQAGKDVMNIIPSILHTPQAAGEASEAWRQGERTPENAMTVAGSSMLGGVKLARTPGVVSDPAAIAKTGFKEPPAPPVRSAPLGYESAAAESGLAKVRADIENIGKVPPPPPGFEPVPQNLGAAASGVKEPLSPVTKPEVAAVADDLNRLRQSGVADRAEISQRMEATPPEFKDPALQERLYHAIENPAEMAKLTPPERMLFDQHIQPMRAELTELYNKVKQYGGEDMVTDPTYVHRIAKGHAPVYDTLSGSAADPVTGTGRGLNRTTSALQGRKFFALEDELGNRFVVSKGDGATHIWTKGKPTLMTAEVELRPGTEVELGGKTFDVKQATTQEIETNSAVRYHKNAAVNTADALVRMREVARNMEYLDGAKKKLFEDGRATQCP